MIQLIKLFFYKDSLRKDYINMTEVQRT